VDGQPTRKHAVGNRKIWGTVLVEDAGFLQALLSALLATYRGPPSIPSDGRLSKYCQTPILNGHEIDTFVDTRVAAFKPNMDFCYMRQTETYRTRKCLRTTGAANCGSDLSASTIGICFLCSILAKALSPLAKWAKGKGRP